MDTLAAFAVQFFGDMTGVNRDLDTAVNNAEKAGAKAGQRFTDSLKQEISRFVSGGGVGSLLNPLMAGSLQGATGGGLFKEIYAAGRAASGAASGIGVYRRQLQSIVGDAGKAEAALSSLKGLVSQSNFDTDAVMRLGVDMVARRGGVQQGTKDTGSLMDAAAAMQVENRNFAGFAAQLQSLLPHGYTAVGEGTIQGVQQISPTIVPYLAKTMGVNPRMAEMRLQGMTGDQLMNKFVQIGQANKGAAAGAGGDLPSTMARIGKDVGLGMAPTGDLINRGLLPFAAVMEKATNAASRFNEATGGSAGLSVGLGLSTLAAGLLVAGAKQVFDSGVKAAGAVTLLAKATDALAQSATVAAGKGGVGAWAGMGSGLVTAGAEGAGAATAIGGTFKGLSASSKGVAGPFGALAGEGGALAGEVNALARIGPALKGVGAWAGIGRGLTALLPTGVALAESAGAGAARSAGHMRLGNTLEKSSEGVSLGSLTGSIIGGIGGGIVGALGGPAGIFGGIIAGSTAGGLVGGGIGGVSGAVQGYMEKPEEKSSPTERLLRQIANNTGAIRETSSRAIGGGPRGRTAVTQAEREWAVAQLTGGAMPGAIVGQGGM